MAFDPVKSPRLDLHALPGDLQEVIRAAQVVANGAPVRQRRGAENANIAYPKLMRLRRALEAAGIEWIYSR